MRQQTRQGPPFWLAMALCLAALAGYALLRLYVYRDHLVPLTYALPLLLALWHKHRGLHYGLVVAFSALAATEVFTLTSRSAAELPDPVSYTMMLTNIWVVGLVVDMVIKFQRRLLESHQQLEQANAELEASNEELAAREEEISSQNEELQRQTEELEQQMEESQEQAEELQRQGEELQQLNEELAGRERVLQALLKVSTTQLRTRESAATGVCGASLEAFGEEVSAALVLGRDDGEVVMQGHCGVELPAAQNGDAVPYNDPLVLTVFDERRTAAIDDLATTPEVVVPATSDGCRPRAAMATPIWLQNEVIGVLALYSTGRRQWSESDFRIAEWLAAQAGLVLLSARLQKELDDRTRQAEEASRQKTRFLAAVSHDVRTPVNAISLVADLIKQSKDDPEFARQLPELIDTLRSSANMLVDLVSDVLDLSRYDSGKIELEVSDFCLHEAIRAEINQYQPLADAAGLSLSAEVQPEPIWLRTDRMKLARVLGNLIGNAIKFTEVGSVQLGCRRNDSGDVEIHVHDSGVGIHPDHLEHIYDEFYQISNPERDRSKGTGLGLAICKRLIDALNCSLSVQSQLGQGTVFTLRIPDELVVEEARPSAVGGKDGDDASSRSLEGIHVLVVEDHEATRRAVSALLARQGARVEQAEDARSALHALGHHTPDVLLLDLMLPDMDGREILKRLQHRRPHKLRCLLAVSGDLTDARRKEVHALGADGLLPKPVQLETLIGAICSRLSQAAPLKGVSSLAPRS